MGLSSSQMGSGTRRDRPALLCETTDIDHAAGQRLRFRREQEGNDVGDIVAFSDPAGCRPRYALAEPRGVAADAAETHAADDAATAGNDGVDADALVEEVV